MKGEKEWCSSDDNDDHLFFVQLLSHGVLCDPWTVAQVPLLFTVSWSLLTLIAVESVMLSNHFILSLPLLLLPKVFLNIRSFPVSQLLTSGGHTVGASPSATVLPVNIQGSFPLELTSLIWSSDQANNKNLPVFLNLLYTKHYSKQFKFIRLILTNTFKVDS